jgi:hypothetical protein
MAQATSTKRPIFRAATTNLASRGSLEFACTDDFMQTAAWTALTLPTSYVLICDVTNATPTVAGFMMQNRSTASARLYVVDTPPVQWAAGLNGNQIVSSLTLTTGRHAARVLLANGVSNGRLNVDGTAYTQAINMGTQTSNGLTLAANLDGAYPLGFRVGFAAVYNGDVTGHASWSAFKTWAYRYYGATLG